LGALESLAAGLGVTLEQAAAGIITIANSHMADAIRSQSSERGLDPRDAVLIAFGGAGPLFSTVLARELEIGTIVIPRHAGNFSAWGLLQQDVSRSAAVTTINRLDKAGLDRAGTSFTNLVLQLRSATRFQADTSAAEVLQADLDLRYYGQEYTLTVKVPVEDGQLDGSPESIRLRFTEDYERTFGHSLRQEVEIVSVRATLVTPLPRQTNRESSVANNGRSLRKDTVEAYSFVLGRTDLFSLIDRNSLEPGGVVNGPAVLLEETATTYLDRGYRLVSAPGGVLSISAALEAQ
jgi:N-methylhydantoinase A